MFLLFETSHTIPLLILIGLGIALYYLAKKGMLTQSFLLLFSLTFPIIETGTYIWQVASGRGDAISDLPLDLCDICAYILPWAIYKNNRYWLGILYFWILAGTTQAVITPDIGASFPDIIYFKYWYIHGGLILSILAAIFQKNFRITKQDAGRAIAWSQVYLAVMLVLNFLLQTNFGYLRKKPDSATILDFMGPWPIYILWGEVMMIILVGLLLLPWLRFNSAIPRQKVGPS